MSYTYAQQESELVKKARMVTAEIKAFEKAYTLTVAQRPLETVQWHSESEALNRHFDEKVEYYQMMMQMNLV